MAQWTLTDDSTGSPVVLTFDWNPSEFDPPGRASNIVADVTSAPNGQSILFQGRDKVRTLTFKGAVGTQSFFASLDLWKDKFYPLTLTDDQGSTWTVMFQDWKWTKIKRRNRWRYDYTAKMFVL